MEYVCIKNFIKINFSGNNAFLFTAKVKDILSIYYVAVRGRDNVEGAVQRVLNKRRISSIRTKQAAPQATWTLPISTPPTPWKTPCPRSRTKRA